MASEKCLLAAIMRASGHGRAIEMRELSISLNIDRRQVSRHVSVLSLSEDKNAKRRGPFVRVSPSSRDKRSKSVTLTEEGVAVACRLGNLLRDSTFEARGRIEELYGAHDADKVDAQH